MPNKFIVSVADVYLYDKCDAAHIEPFVDGGDGTAKLSTSTALITAQTLTDSSIDTTISNTDTRGGFGNQLLNVFYHSAEMTLNFTDAQFNLLAVKALVGDTAYAETGAANNIITIAADYVPKSVEAVLVAKVAGEASNGCTGIIGTIVITIPLAQLDGAVSIALTADGVATTPFKARALASNGYYAKIYELGLPTVANTYVLTVLTALTFVAGAYYLPEDGAKYYDDGEDKIFEYTQNTGWDAGTAPTATPTNGTDFPSGTPSISDTYVRTAFPTADRVTIYIAIATDWVAPTTEEAGSSAATADMEIAAAFDLNDEFYQKFEISYPAR